MAGKIAVYTCIVGGYDQINEPLVYEDNCDYYLISDMPGDGLVSDRVTWIDVNSVVPDPSMSPKDKNLYCKMHPHEIFVDYEYSIYVDGSIQIVKPISHYINKVGNSGLAAHRHRTRICAYREAVFITWLGVAKREDVLREVEIYIYAGFPRDYGLFECGVLVTDLSNQYAGKIFELWFEMYRKGCGRDQLSFVYSCWKNGLSADDVGSLGGDTFNIATNPDFCWDSKSHYRK